MEVLPEGWSAELDPDSGYTYYYNHVTGESAWEIPTAATEPAADDSATLQGEMEVLPSRFARRRCRWCGACSGTRGIRRVAINRRLLTNTSRPCFSAGAPPPTL